MAKILLIIVSGWILLSILGIICVLIVLKKGNNESWEEETENEFW